MSKLSTRGVVICAGLALATTQPATLQADDHPTTLGNGDSKYGFEWVAASEVLSDDGSLASRPMHRLLREGLEWQLQNAPKPGAFAEAELPPPESCAPMQVIASYPTTESGDHFGTTLLLSDVAMTATVHEAIPGFDEVGNPVVLFALADAVRLHPYASTLEYVLVPFDRLLVHGRVFCLSNGPGTWWRGALPPAPGDQVVVIGSWSADGVVRMGRYRHSGALVRIREGSEELADWLFAATKASPRSMADLREEVARVASGGLFALTTHLVGQNSGSAERRAFGKRWRELHQGGCVVVRAEEQPGTGLMPVVSCPPSRRPEQ